MDNDKIEVGPESVPLKNFIDSLMVTVLIYRISDNKLIKKEEVDYGDVKSRKWLGKVSYWAWNQNCYVKTLPTEIYNKSKD